MILFENFINETNKDNSTWLKIKIVDFLTNYDISNNDELNDFVKKIGINNEIFYREILDILISIFQYGKYQNRIKNGENVKIDSNELNVGIRFETEHTNNELIAKRIALDHLVDCPQYYTLLKELEKKCK